MREKVNEEVKEYIAEKNRLINEYKEKTKKLEEESPIISVSAYYDIRPIEATRLKPHIANVVRGINGNAYTKHSSVVFDSNSYNFHIFPENSEERISLSKDFAKIRDALCESINQISNKPFTIAFPPARKNPNYYTGKTGGTGSRGNIIALEAIEGDGAKDGNGIYKFIQIKVGNTSYTLNFMRYTCDENGVVGCTMRAIQFHKHLGAINKDNKGNFNICYPSSDEHGKIGLQHFQNEEGKYAGNICYNPPVEWPNKNGVLDSEEIKKIASWFVYFIAEDGDKEKMNCKMYNK